MSEEFTADTTAMRELARRLDALGEQAGTLTNRATSRTGTPRTAEFPAMPVGQQAGRLWADTRTTLADALRLTRNGLADLAAGIRASADNYDAADTAAARQMEIDR